MKYTKLDNNIIISDIDKDDMLFMQYIIKVANENIICEFFKNKIIIIEPKEGIYDYEYYFNYAMGRVLTDSEFKNHLRKIKISKFYGNI